jgi:prepilin-type N-terminal cleavage/methylation domain-containing protein
MNNRKTIQAFTLVELAVVLTIMALLSVSAMVLVDRYSEKQKYDLTIDRMNTIMKYIKLYAKEWGRVPCPASPTISFLGTDPEGNFIEGYASSYGSAWNGSPNDLPTVPSDTRNPNCWASVISGSVKTDTRIGALPYLQLNLRPEFMFDGWGNRFTYAMYLHAKQRGALFEGDPLWINTQNCCDDASATNGPVVTDLSGWAALESSPIVVLVSHGANGLMAFPGSGGARITPPAAISGWEDVNSNDEGQFRATMPTGSAFGGIDDIVMHLNFWELSTK